MCFILDQKVFYSFFKTHTYVNFKMACILQNAKLQHLTKYRA